MNYEPLIPICNTCNSPCVLSVELIEEIIKHHDDLEADDIDALIEKSLRGEDASAPFDVTVPFPIALNIQTKTLDFFAWCSKCKRAVVIRLDIYHLIDFLKGGV